MKRFILITILFFVCQGAILNYERLGAIPDDSSVNTSWWNGGLLNKTLANMNPGDTLLIPNKTYWLFGGIQANNLNSVIIQLDGTLSFLDDLDNWPRINGSVLDCFIFNNFNNVTFTSSGKGTMNGNGGKWWGIPLIGYAERAGNRPKMFTIFNSQNTLVENWFFYQSPLWNFHAEGVDGLEVRFCDIVAKRNNYDGHDIDDLSAFNTDGFDISGNNVWVHDSSVWNQDDCFCVKDGSTNMVFERLTASGLGLTIGSIGSSLVSNITFRDVYMPHTYKGIYMKFREEVGQGVIENVLYENIFIESPEQWAIWIGPAQQSISADICKPNPCSLCWPRIPLTVCNLPSNGLYRNITLRNITISDPKRVGVIMANETNPMQGVVFEDVKVVNQSDRLQEKEYFRCLNVENGVALGDSWPVPSCFANNTTKFEEEY